MAGVVFAPLNAPTQPTVARTTHAGRRRKPPPALARLDVVPHPSRLRVQLLFGNLFTAEIVDVGADGTFVLPAGFDNDFGPVSLFNVAPPLPQGTWSMRCALEHPASGVVLAEGFFPFEVQ